MKNYLPLVLCLLLSPGLSAQQSAKKYVLIEHFTNSKCSVCANKNPAFYNLIGQAQYADDIHHISIHPSFPYNTCVFYQANTTENTAWTNLYPGVQGTPTIVMNGAVQAPVTPLLTESKLQTFLNQTSPLYIQVNETSNGASRTAVIETKALGEIPPGNYKLFVAVAEKTINQQTPNGEAVHHDVFRKMLTAVAGDPFTAPAMGSSVEFTFDYTVSNTWNASEIYVLAFVKEVDTKDVLNSGTRFDPVLTDTEEASVFNVQISPNPATDWARVSLAEDDANSVEVYAANGQRIAIQLEDQGSSISIPLQGFAPGLYYVKIKGIKGSYTGKFVKQ